MSRRPALPSTTAAEHKGSGATNPCTESADDDYRDRYVADLSHWWNSRTARAIDLATDLFFEVFKDTEAPMSREEARAEAVRYVERQVRGGE